MSNPIQPNVISATARAAQSLIPAHDAPEARADALAKATALLMQASAELMRAGRDDLAHRVHDIARQAEQQA